MSFTQTEDLVDRDDPRYHEKTRVLKDAQEAYWEYCASPAVKEEGEATGTFVVELASEEYGPVITVTSRGAYYAITNVVDEDLIEVGLWCIKCDQVPCYCTQHDNLFLRHAEDFGGNGESNYLTNKQHRFRLYQAFTYTIHGVLRKGQRKPLPLCMEEEIQYLYPKPSEMEYVGYIPVGNLSVERETTAETTVELTVETTGNPLERVNSPLNVEPYSNMGEVERVSYDLDTLY